MTSRPPPIGPKHLDITGPARADIDEALAYIAREAGLDTALRFADQIDQQLYRLAELGHAGVSREWISPGLRLTLIGSYSVYFRVTPTATIIVRFLRGSRDISQVEFGGGAEA